MDSAIEEVLEDQASPQDYDDESSFEVISDSDDPVSPETDHSAPAKPVDETSAPAPTPARQNGNAASSSLVDLTESGSAGKNVQAAPAKLVTYHSTPTKPVAEKPAHAPTPDPGNAASSSLVVLAGSGSADKNVLSAPAVLVAETIAPAPTPDPETGNTASSSLVVLAGSGSAANIVQEALVELVAETTAPATMPEPKTGNAASSSLAVFAGSGSAGNHFQDENSLAIGQSDEGYRERDQRRAEKFQYTILSKEKSTISFANQISTTTLTDVKDFGVNHDLLFRRYLSCPELDNHSDSDDSDDSDCSIDIIDEQNEVKLNNFTYFSDSGNFVAPQ